ncbi:tRNA pseudouridine synthase [Pluteus cervinus]|uniref:tRNA pseudouridine synthase n=1 Tax=Pluteus cervinus TaxID=181527 RepID=A0ACD3ACV0_9AGAR|nr:tRNA pseudouridine synthase [Pluteus cervinus]
MNAAGLTRYHFARSGIYSRRMTPTSGTKYDSWSREDLIARLVQIEQAKFRPVPKPDRPSTVASAPSSSSTSTSISTSTSTKLFHFAAQPRRKIALKFCYSGWEYGGLAYQNVPTPLPTVEGVMFDAFAKARLIDPEAGMDGCGWEKCGRTDRGVSAAGQVISLWVRSALKGEHGGEAVERVGAPTEVHEEAGIEKQPLPGVDEDPFPSFDLTDEVPSNTSTSTTLSPPKPAFEHDYLAILNRILPPTIRILAWSPVKPTFSARYACTYRHYKYFFSNHDNSLDIPLIQDAASRLVGEHDFRNLCKLDPAKQITIFTRRILRAEIDEVQGSEGMYVLNLVGSAFLYHQVRHIMAILLLVGSGLEHPSVVSSLLNVSPNTETSRPNDPPLEVVDRKPEYQMADALPLMLWECGYPPDELDWRTNSTYGTPQSLGVDGSGSELYHQMQSIWTRSQIYTVLDQHFLQASSRHHPSPTPVFPVKSKEELQGRTTMLNVPLGGGVFKRASKYVEVLNRSRIEHFEVTNERWRLGKGARKEERKREVANDDSEE